MSLWRQITHGLRVLTRRSAADQHVNDEVEHYLQETTAALIAEGRPPEEARRAARMAIGNATRIREEVRDGGWEHVIDTSLSDLRYGARQLRSSRGFAVVSILTLALGIGASTAIFSAVNPILFEPLPYPNPDRIVTIWDTGPDGARIAVTFGTYRELLERSRLFDAMAVMRPWQPTITDAGQPQRLEGQRVSLDYFRALGILPALGRTFAPTEDRVGGPKVVVLSHGLWRRRFGGDVTIVGRQITLDENAYTVAGVMSAAFENVLSPTADVWTPLQYDISLPPDGREWGHHLRMIARLRPDVPLAQAAEELATIAQNPIAQFVRQPWASLSGGFVVTTLHDDVTRGIRPALLAVVGAVVLVLAIACVNVTNLLLTRAARRRTEFAMRVALGAPRSRLIRQSLTESLLLAGVGGGLGLLIAVAGVRALLAVSPEGLPRAHAIAIDGTVFAFACALTTIVGMLVGLIPAMTSASRVRMRTAIEEGSRRTAGVLQWPRRALVAAEVGLALVLLVGAGLLLRSVQSLFAVAPGFDPAHVLTMQVQTSGLRFRDPVVTHRFFADALEAVRRVPGVSAAGLTSQLPLSGDYDKYGVQFESIPTLNPEEDQSAFRYAVSPGYFEALRIPLRRGRLLNEHDRAGAPVVALINESFAKRKFGDRDPLGQRVRVGRTDGPWAEIVGVVGDIKQASLAITDADAAYVPTTQWYFADNPLWLVVRGEDDLSAQATAIREAIWSVDKQQPIVRVAMMESLVSASVSEQRFALILFEIFAAAALMLAAIGVYGILSGSVSERTREIGIRSALGASRRMILVLVLREGVVLTALGIGAGLIAAIAASESLVTLLFGISRLDPLTYGGVVALLLTVSFIAAAFPAARAAAVDPAITLRMD